MSSGQSRPGRRVQLHRALAKLGWGSRTQAWAWIRAGEVCVGGQVVTDPLTWVDLDRQRITCGGRNAVLAPPVTLAFYKPGGIVTTRSDERGRPTVYDLLPPDLPWIFPAGRLDADSEGLLIFTNDARLAVRLTEPEHRVPKTYHVRVRGVPAAADLERLRHGVELADGRTRPARVKLLEKHSDGTTVVEMVLTEGRNRQIRRMWAALGYRVRRLVRVAIGDFRPDDLTVGACRFMNAMEVEMLMGSRVKR
jgi:pseudouridine synthase